jgi:hypothetical protein
MWGRHCCRCEEEECGKLLTELRELNRTASKLLKVAEYDYRIQAEQLKILRRIEHNTTPHTTSIGIDFSTLKKEQ